MTGAAARPPVPARSTSFRSTTRASNGTMAASAADSRAAAAAAGRTARSAPSSRRNSSSSDDEDFEEQMNIALAASVESIASSGSSANTDSGNSSPTDNAIREALTLSLAETERSATDGAAFIGSRSANPQDIFLEALRTAVVGDDDVNDVDEDEDFVMLAPDRGLRDVRMTALNATLTNMGIAPFIRNTIERLLSRATGSSAAASDGRGNDGDDPIEVDVDDDDDDDAYTSTPRYSLADVTFVMREMGKGESEIDAMVRALRERPVRF